MVIPGTRPLFKRKQKLFILFTCNLKNEIHICSNKHETGLLYCNSKFNVDSKGGISNTCIWSKNKYCHDLGISLAQEFTTDMCKTDLT